MSPGPTGRRLRVRYAFRGPGFEMQQTFPLRPGEHQLAHGLVAHRRLGVLGGPALVLVTDQRLCMVVHYAFRRDVGYELPRGSVVNVRPIKVPTITFYRLTYRGSNGSESVDIADVQVRGGGTVFMGPEVSIQHLFQTVRDNWGPDSPTFNV